MKKARLAALFLAAAMLTASVPAMAYSGSALVPQARTCQTAFADTRGTWCDAYAKTCYEAGLMDGKSATRFDPAGSLTCAQIIAITARLHELMNGGDGKFGAAGAGEEWFQPYLDYLTALSSNNDALSEALWFLDDVTAPCDRYDFVWLLSAVLPDSALTAVNSIVSLPDVYGDEDILDFYNAGILTGVNAYGAFDGLSGLNRGQAAAMLARLVDPSLRVKFVPKAFSFSRELLGLAPDATVLTIDGYPVSAELYAYQISTEIASREAEASYGYYDTYAKYLDEYYDDANYYSYDTFADYLLQVHGIDVSGETVVQWNKADKAGLTPADKAAANVLDSLKQIAALFNHADRYSLTDSQKKEIQENMDAARTLSYGYTDAFLNTMQTLQVLTENMSRNYAPSSAQINDFLAEYNYFYGRYICVGYDLGSEASYGRTKSEAMDQITTVKQNLSGHLSDRDYFSYLCWKYGDYGYDEPTLIPVDLFSGSTRTALKSLSVGAVSSLVYEEDVTSQTGCIYLFLKDDPSHDEEALSSIGSIPAAVQLSVWAETAVVTTTDAYGKFTVSALADKYDALYHQGLLFGFGSL